MNQDSIASRYDIVQQIGKGGQGTVYLANTKSNPSYVVAVKIIPITTATKNLVAQELSAIKAVVGQYCVPYIVCYHDSFFDYATNQAVIEMDYIQGPTVMQYTHPLRETGNIPLLIQSCRALTRAMLQALSFVHERGILHNDIKPSNIVINPQRVPILVDFGISCFVQEAVNQLCTAPYNKTISNCCNTQAGTSLYLPPEAIKNVRYPQSDLWSLGSTIYSVMTGSNIWNINLVGTSPVNIMQEVVNNFTQIRPPARLASGDQNLDLVINSFLTYDPASRMSIPRALSYLK